MSTTTAPTNQAVEQPQQQPPVVFSHADKLKDNDNYMTPEGAWKAIVAYIPKNRIIWEPFYGDGKSGEFLRKLGFEVIHENKDFFLHNEGEIVVSNPPFSIKKEVLTRLKELGKPFILLLPTPTQQTNYFQDLFGSEMQFIHPKSRIHYCEPGTGTVVKGCSFDSLYFCWKMNLPHTNMYLRNPAPAPVPVPAPTPAPSPTGE